VEGRVKFQRRRPPLLRSIKRKAQIEMSPTGARSTLVNAAVRPLRSLGLSGLRIRTDEENAGCRLRVQHDNAIFVPFDPRDAAPLPALTPGPPPLFGEARQDDWGRDASARPQSPSRRGVWKGNEGQSANAGVTPKPLEPSRRNAELAASPKTDAPRRQERPRIRWKNLWQTAMLRNSRTAEFESK
jgi:hypothetical protein